MKLALVSTIALTLSATACVQGSDAQYESGGPEPSYSSPPPPYVPRDPTLEQSYAHFRCGTDGYNCVAVGGTYDVDVHGNGWQLDASPLGSVDVDAQSSAGAVTHYRFRATTLGEGDVDISASFIDTAGGHYSYAAPVPRIHAVDVEDVKLGSTEDAYALYTFASETRAFPANGEGFVQLFSADNSPLVDTTTQVTGVAPPLGAEYEPLTSYGRFYVGVAPGPRHIVVRADSFGERSFDITVAGRVTRVEGDVVTPAAGPGEEGIVCFHTYWNAYEVPRDASAFSLIATNVTIGSHYDVGRNCWRFSPDASGAASLTAIIEGVTTTVSVAAPQS
ncbi:MAG TPA: hypothetical protein VGM90_39070 [Kofleriaceae bacterium]|jgi:hypothetical protein